MYVSELVQNIYRRPEILTGMDLETTRKAKTEIEEIIAKFDAHVKKLAKAWEDDYNANSNGNEWYWSQEFEKFNNAFLAKGVWDQILVCVNAHLAGEL